MCHRQASAPAETAVPTSTASKGRISFSARIQVPDDRIDRHGGLMQVVPVDAEGDIGAIAHAAPCPEHAHTEIPAWIENDRKGGARDGARTRDLRRDRPAL